MMVEGFCYLAELSAYDKDASAAVVLRYGTGLGFITGAADSPAHTMYEPRLEQPVEVTRSIFAPGTTQGQSRIGFGELTILNPDGDLDVLLLYALDGRAVVVRRGPARAASLAEFTDVFAGTMEQAEFSADRITITLRDRQVQMNRPLQANRYAGTNALPAGVDGVRADLAGKPKPLTFGRVKNVQPPIVNTARVVYQVHDGAIASLDAVYDRGIALTSDGTYGTLSDVLNDGLQPGAGQFKVWLAGGLFRLGSSPAGVITADVTQGATSGARTAAALYEAVLLRMGVAAGDILATDLTALTTRNPAELGVYLDDETRAADVLDAVATTVGAWWGANRDGVYRIVVLDRPTGAPVLTLTAEDLMGPPVRESTADPERGLPVYQTTVRYAQNFTVQTDLASGVTDARRAIVAQQWREATATDATVQPVHRLAALLTIDSLFADEADALTEAQRLLVLRSRQRHRFEVTTLFDDRTSALDLNDVVGLLHPRYGLGIAGDEIGRLFRVIGIEPDARTERLRLTLWGAALTTRNLVTHLGEYLVTHAGDHLVTPDL